MGGVQQQRGCRISLCSENEPGEVNIRNVRNRHILLWEGYNNNNHGFVSQDPSGEAISYLSAFVFAGLQGKKTHTHKVLWEKC